MTSPAETPSQRIDRSMLFLKRIEDDKQSLVLMNQKDREIINLLNPLADDDSENESYDHTKETEEVE